MTSSESCDFPNIYSYSLKHVFTWRNMLGLSEHVENRADDVCVLVQLHV